MHSHFLSFILSASRPDLHSFPTRRSSDLSSAKATYSRSINRLAWFRCNIVRRCGRRRHEESHYSRFRRSFPRSEEHTSELQSLRHLVCRLLLEKKKEHTKQSHMSWSLTNT